MIRDAKGRKWFMRFIKYQKGWQWNATHKNHGQSSGENLFKTKAEAEADARQDIQGHDSIALGGEYFRRLQLRGSHCQLTAEDHKAIERAGMNKG
jgi:hypothetical protein